ncbi:MAG: protease modulator HflK [Pseudomonas sp.]|uniref:protease modulator HflK n=1 Tax=Pseudomonas abieticivorans TaxID=2931382 RepID=UPI0020C1538B|nr:protease modulator HflK [Pseudomonas sp. PIA16]MDE1164834.1 protease modulator HflK [Pseudomonas sp.]
MSSPDLPRAGANGPWLQAGRMAFLALYGVTLLTAFGWGVSNIRQVGPESRAVVLRMGALQRVQSAGLLLAWPRPFEQVVMLPSADRVIEQRVQTLLRENQTSAIDLNTSRNSDAVAGAGYLLTGDAGVVQLDVRVFYKVTEPYAYVLQSQHLQASLDRLVARSAVAVSASRDLDTILVARPELVGSDSKAAERRERLRGDLMQGINQSLAALQKNGSGLGVHIERVDLQSSLPDGAVNAFNAVLTASQKAEQNIAAARNDAAKLTQAATQNADRTLQVAHAQASERLAKAQSDTATITSLAQTQHDHSDPGLLQRLYRERIPGILAKAGSVTTVDPRDDAHLILQGNQP